MIPATPHPRIRNFLLPFTLMICWTLLSATSCKDEIGKVAGTVSFKGVPCQPGQPDFNVPPCSGPYPNYEVIIYHASAPEQPVLTIKSGSDGNYHADLPAGDYRIYTQNGIRATDRTEHKFTIKPAETITLNLTVFTGIL